MPGRAKSVAAKSRAKLQAAQEREEHIVNTYNVELAAYHAGTGPKPSYRGVAKRFGIDYRLLQRRQQGVGLSKWASNAQKSHLTEPESLVLIDFTIEMARRAFPLSLQALRHHALEIAQLRQPNLKELGHNWVQRFMTRYGGHISTKWSVSLDTIRAKCVNPAVIKHYYNLLENTLKEHDFRPQNIYGFDESGFPLGGSKKTRVIGARSGSGTTQRNNDKENVTIMACICANGSNVPPIVIFEGQYFLEKWIQKNPTNAAYCRSRKGWTDNEIGADWLQWFNEHTRAKLEAGEKRLLLLDGHVSHFSKAFIERAIELSIVVLCYPPHSTHLLQGLDVVLFSRVKAEWTKSRDTFEWETGEGMSKETFLQVFGETYIAAFTPENNKKAFSKTGVHPFDRSVIKRKDLAPSLEHSKYSSPPVEVPEPVERFLTIFRQTIEENDEEEVEIDDDDDWGSDEEVGDLGSNNGDVQHEVLFHQQPQSVQGHSPSSDQPLLASMPAESPKLTVTRTPPHQRLRKSLQSVTPLRSLVNTASDSSPEKVPKRVYLCPTTRVNWQSLPRPADDLADENTMLQEELAKARRRDEEYEGCLQVAHSQLAMMGMYAETCRQCAAAASRRKKSGRGRQLNGTGWARIVSDAQLLEEINRMDEEAETAEREKAARREARALKKTAAAGHKAFTDARRDAWEAVKSDYEVAVQEWIEDGRNGAKPTCLKQREAYLMLGLDNEESWNGV